MSTPTARPPLKDRTMGEIAVALPGAMAVLRRLKLDCGDGDTVLAAAAAKQGADLVEIEQALAALDDGPGASVPGDTGALIDYILTQFHEAHRRELPELVRLAAKVEAVHSDHPEVPRGLAAMLEALRLELEEHMRKEETILFPLMRQGGHPMIAHPIAQMRRDHEEHRECLQGLEEIANDFHPPAGACRSWQALYAGAAKFVDDFTEHTHLENRVLFLRFEGRQTVEAPWRGIGGPAG